MRAPPITRRVTRWLHGRAFLSRCCSRNGECSAVGFEIAITVRVQACLGRVLDTERDRIFGAFASKCLSKCRTRKCARQPAAWLATRARNPEENDGPPACCFCCQPCLSFLTTRSIPDTGEIGGSTQGHLAEFLRRELSAFSFSLFNEPYLFTPPHWRRISTE